MKLKPQSPLKFTAVEGYYKTSSFVRYAHPPKSIFCICVYLRVHAFAFFK